MTSPVQGESICPVINAYRANKAQLDAFHFDRPSDDDIQSMFHGLERDLGVESDRLTVDNKWKIVYEREKRRWHEEKDRQQDLEQRLADTDGSPSIGVSDGQAYIEKFMSSTITPKDLQGLGVSLRTMPLAWFSSFIEMKGIAVLAFQLNVLNRPGFSRGEVEAQQEIEILKCLKTILNSPVGQREVTSKQTTVNHIITVLGSPHIPSRKLGLKLIVALCYLDDRSLQSVLMALEAFSNSNQENGAFTFWFKVTLATMLGHEAMKIPADASEDFEKTVRTEVSLDGYILNTLMLINGILNRTVDPKTRKSLRANMELAGLQDIVELAQELQEDNLMSDMKQLSVSTEEDLDGLSGEAEQLNGTSEAPQYFSARATAKSSQITQNLSKLKANPSGQIRRGRRNKSLIPSYDGSINNSSYGVAESTDNNQNSTNRKDSLITAKEKPQGSSLPRRAQRVPRGYKRLSRSEIADTPAGAAPISRGMSPSVISRCLTQHGCSDITHRLNPASCSEHPVSNGGFGDVYQARLDDGSLVAVKCTRVTNDSLDRLKNQNLTDAAREIHAWSKLKHRYILKLFGLALFRGQVAMISPWIQRGSLVSYLENRPELNRLRLCTQIAEGLTYLHQSGVVHGDLKGANILMSETDEPLLADFGNAVLQERTLKFTYTTTRTALSPRWTAPELLSDRPCSFEADVYAFGMTILEIVTGSAPFSELRSDMAVMFAISQGKLPARPENHIPTGSKNADFFWLLLNRCWSFEPGCRVRMVEVKHGIMAINPQDPMSVAWA